MTRGQKLGRCFGSSTLLLVALASFSSLVAQEPGDATAAARSDAGDPR